MSERYRREIEEILGDIERPPPERAKSERRSLAQVVLKSVGRFLGGRSCKLSPGRVVLGSLVLLLVALLFRASMPGLVAPIAWAAVVMFILGYALFFISPLPAYEKRWRARLIERPPTLRERFLHWMKSRS